MRTFFGCGEYFQRQFLNDVNQISMNTLMETLVFTKLKIEIEKIHQERNLIVPISFDLVGIASLCILFQKG